MKVIAAKLAKDGETPLEFMVRLMRTPLPTQVKGEEELDYLKRCKEHFLTQQDMAKAAAPYIHPCLASTVISGDEDKPIAVKLSLAEGARRIAFVLAKASREMA
tara:strand:+ start:204 stop:515 length:312 start_codon:yes stop_codon:yes gene_type:complete